MLGACAEQDSTYTKYVDGKALLVDTVDQTITAGGDMYYYHIDGNRVTITYPDGWRYEEDSVGFGGYIGDLTMDYSISRYADGAALVQALTGRGRPVDKEKNYFFALFAILIGMIHAALTERAWYLKRLEV